MHIGVNAKSILWHVGVSTLVSYKSWYTIATCLDPLLLTWLLQIIFSRAYLLFMECFCCACAVLVKNLICMVCGTHDAIEYAKVLDRCYCTNVCSVFWFVFVGFFCFVFFFLCIHWPLIWHHLCANRITELMISKGVFVLHPLLSLCFIKEDF